MNIFVSRKHQPKFALYYICQYTIMIQQLFAPFIMNCQRDFKMCPSMLIHVLIRVMIMNCLNRSQISSFENVRFKMYKHRLSLWITYGILRSIKYRDLMFRKVRSTANGTDLSSSLSVNRSSYRKKNVLKETIRVTNVNINMISLR